MKNASTALRNFIPATRQFFEADLFTIAPGAPQNWLSWSNRFEKPVYNTSLVTLTPNTADLTDPNGGSSACKMLATGSSGADGQAIDQQLGCPQNTWASADPAARLIGQNVVTFSVWLRTLSGSTSALALTIRESDNVSISTDAKKTIAITSAWQRFYVTRVLDNSATTTRLEVFLRGTNPTVGGFTWDNTVPAIYAWGAQVECRSTPGPNIQTFATPKFGNAGPIPELIRVTTCDQDITWQGNTYISGSAQNLLRFSEDLEVPGVLGWNGSGTGGTPTVTPDTTADPLGNTNVADRINYPAATAGQESYMSQDAGFVPIVGKSYIFSVWLKAGTLSTAYIRLVQSTGENSTFSPALTLTSSWQRFSVTITPTSVGTGDLLVRINNTNFTLSASAGNFFAWGAQLEQSDTVGRYLPTYAIPQAGIGKITRSKLKWTVGTTVDTMDISFDVPQLSALLARGFFDGARVTFDRLFGNSPTSLVDSVTLFAGNVADVKGLGRTRAQLQLRSRMDLLNNSLPRLAYQPSCWWSLYDAGCTLSKLHFGTIRAVSSGSNVSAMNSTITDADHYYDLGTIVFLTGINAGVAVTVKASFSSGVVTFFAPLPNPPAAGDVFVGYPGCDKTQATCNSKFSNLLNFGGQPYVPAPEAAF